jgi:radical SAM protein with 4Fe4S-binding SPASM domain
VAEGKGGESGVSAPHLVSWNITLRCPLTCTHCYIDAGEREAEQVLSTDEALGVIDQIRELGKPVVVLSGGEPLMRDDIFTIARYGTDKGLRMALGTSGVLIDEGVAREIHRSGIRRVAVSIDSADPAVHDAFRGIPGAWERAVQGIRHCRDAGIAIQINTTVLSSGLQEIRTIVSLGTGLGVTDYQIFFPVPTGRGNAVPWLTPKAYEDLIKDVLTTYRDSGVHIRPTCAPQFRRIAGTLGIHNPYWGRGCIAGISYCRIFANGDVTPCPYLPARAGNVRETPLKTIWEESPVFKVLRDPSMLTGKCGRCGYRDICGGCRARSYRPGRAVTDLCGGIARPDDPQGDLCGADPWCRYEPGQEPPPCSGSVDPADRALLDVLQDDIPLVSRPWTAIASRLGTGEAEVLDRMKRLEEAGIIRGISPVLESGRLGLHAATLVALHVPEERVDEVAAVISGYREVSHNFRRDHYYSLWFTIAARDRAGILRVLDDILQRTRVPASDTLELPTVKKIKIDVRFSFQPAPAEEAADGPG